MAEEDQLNIILALSALCVVKFVSAALYGRKRSKDFEHVGNVSGLNVYPVKSCGPLSLQSVKCTKNGLSYNGVLDRHWMVVKNNGMFINIQQDPKMALIKTSICDDLLCLDAPGMPTLKLEKNPKIDSSLFVDCKIRGVTMTGMSCGQTAADWICQYLGKENLRIIIFPSGMKRRNVSHMDKKPWVNAPTPEDHVTFAEVGVCNIACENSLKDLNSRLEKPVEMGNFRPTIVVQGSTAFDEDSWHEIKIGERVHMRLLEPNPRCALITVDPEGERDAQMEPLRTLRKFRKSPLYGDSPLFGLTTAVDCEGDIQVGDPVYAKRNTK